MKLLDLSYSNISSISTGAFHHLPNLVELDLSYNKFTEFEDNTFSNLPSLAKLNVQAGRLIHIGNIFENLKNQDLVVDFSSAYIEELLKDSFKPFLDNVIEGNGNGHINLEDNSIQCGCGVLWFLTSYMEYQHIIKNATCMIPQLFYEERIEVPMLDVLRLEHLCPPSDCPGYDSGIKQICLK